MSNNLFNNKYYNQLFGGRKQEEQQQQQDDDEHTQDTRERLQRIFGGRKQSGERQQQRQQERQQEEDEQSEETHERLQRIFGGKRQQQRAGASATGKLHEGRAVYAFKNGALAVRMDKKDGTREAGRYKIFQGPVLKDDDGNRTETFNRLLESAKHHNKINKKGEQVVREGRITTARAQKAFEAYWNNRMRAAKTLDARDGTKSKVAGVKRAKSARMNQGLINPESHLNENSPYGWLYLRRQSRKKSKSGKPTRRAGPAMYDFEGVSPKQGASARKSPKSAKQAAHLAKLIAINKQRAKERRGL
jgi:hypothetical protein